MLIIQSGEFLFPACDAVLHTSKYSVPVTVLELYQHNHTTFTFLTTEKLRRAVCLTVCSQLSLCCILRGPSGECIMDVVPGGTELKLQLRRGVGQASHTRYNPHVKCTGVY
jgi:hypothetical protein